MEREKSVRDREREMDCLRIQIAMVQYVFSEYWDAQSLQSVELRKSMSRKSSPRWPFSFTTLSIRSVVGDKKNAAKDTREEV